MKFRRNAQLDTSQVSDRRGAMFLPAAGGGIVGLVILLFTLLNGGGGTSGLSLGTGQENDLSASCQPGEAANQQEDCRIVGVVNSLQAYWRDNFPGYQDTTTVFFSNGTNTGCGSATSAVGPFYCPVDDTVYIDLGFYDELRQRFGAQGGPFAEAYVIAHEYGHHIQDLEGIIDRSGDGTTGPESSSVRIELMADCLAGQWAKGAVDTGYIEDLTEADIADGLNAAASIGDDRIQETTQGQVDPESFTHGTSDQRQRWFLNGFRGSSIDACDTFATGSL